MYVYINNYSKLILGKSFVNIPSHQINANFNKLKHFNVSGVLKNNKIILILLHDR